MRKIIVQEFLDQDDVEQMIGDAIGDITKETVGLGEVDNTADVDKPVSAQQQAALDSKADAEHIHEIDEVTGLQSALDGKANAAHGHDIVEITGISDALAGKADVDHDHGNFYVKPEELAAVATTGSYNDLTDQPDIPDPASFATAAQGAKADTAVQPDDLAAVATSGDYDDLSNKPEIPNPGDFATAAQGAKADTAVQPDDLGSAASADVADFATAAQGAKADSAVQPDDLAAVATSGDYEDLGNKPEIPEQFNPIAGSNMSITGTYPDITFASTASGGGVVDSIVAGDNITVDATDPANPIVSAAGGGGAVDSVNGQTGVVELTASDVGAADATHNHDGAYAGIGHSHVIGDVDGLTDALVGKADVGHNHDGAYSAISHDHDDRYVQASELADVAASGSYDDLTDTPTIPDPASFATAEQGAKADTAIQTVTAGNNVTVDDTDPQNIVISAAGGAVDSVNGQTGVVELTASDVGAAEESHQHEGSGFGSTALGSGANAAASFGAAVGSNATAASYGTALGSGANAAGGSATAVGAFASSGGNSTAVGRGATADDSAIAVGHSANAGGSYSVAVGLGATANGNFSAAVGRYASAGGANSIAFGGSAEANSDYATGVGHNTNASSFGTALGAVTTAAANSVALGHKASADSPNTATITAHTLTLEPRTGDLLGDPTEEAGSIQMYNATGDLVSISVDANNELVVTPV